MVMEVREILPDELRIMLERGETVQVVDVRELEEWEAGHIPQAVHIPLGQLPFRLDELRKDVPVVMVCRSGARSYQATAFASGLGYDAANMAGGMLAWTGDVE